MQVVMKCKFCMLTCDMVCMCVQFFAGFDVFYVCNPCVNVKNLCLSQNFSKVVKMCSIRCVYMVLFCGMRCVLYVRLDVRCENIEKIR